MPGSIVVCRDPRSSQWQIGALPPAAGSMALIGWSLAPPPVDGGVPEAIARVLASALTSAARVTFPTSSIASPASEAWTPSDGDVVRSVVAEGLAHRLARAFMRAPRALTLVSTTRAETAIRLFDDGAFPWWLQGQVALLSGREAAPPGTDAATLFALIEPQWANEAAALPESGVRGVVRPGVDGDVAALLTLDAAFDRIVVGALEREARAAGLEWAIVPESEFALK